MVDRVHLTPPWQVVQLKPGMTRPTCLNNCRPRMAAALAAETGARLGNTLAAIHNAMASCRASRPELLTGRKLVTGGGVLTWSPRRATDRLPRLCQAPLGVPGGPATDPLTLVDNSKTA